MCSRHFDRGRFTILLVNRLVCLLLTSQNCAPCAVESVDDGGKKNNRAVPTSTDKFVGNIANEDSGGERECGDDNADGPLGYIDGNNGESRGTNKNNEDLTANHQGVDAEEEVVLEHALEYVEFVVKTTIAVWAVSMIVHKD